MAVGDDFKQMLALEDLHFFVLEFPTDDPLDIMDDIQWIDLQFVHC
eukprot:CAMPEP_0197042658 /NCGR_PEP_ID=MMETSP1384-20130603/19001_1 /TAXON_ID=29189 /ORGANISM="Ammonia sp." /LENGTH=45 /DNA_ID= /DNA_START= /DNA_END= /DNA_ORIENTATION=